MASVLLVGGGGREHALVEALCTSPSNPTVFVAPGNPGIGEHAELLPISVDDRAGLVEAAQTYGVDYVLVGPEAPLVAGLGDALKAVGIACVGPDRAAAKLEGSKAFAKGIMREARVPTAPWGAFVDAQEALTFARGLGNRAVVKADGLAAGKGVVVAEDFAATERAIRALLGGEMGLSGRQIVVEACLEGEELSVIALTDGERMTLMAPAQDHKRLGDGDRGPNTGGMGAYSPALRATPSVLAEVEETCLRPILKTMAARGTPFRGILYAGLMLTDTGPKVLEYNVRFGDPEAQAILPRLQEDAFLLFESLAKGQLEDRPLRFSKEAAVNVVLASAGYPKKPQKGDIIEGLSSAKKIPGALIFHSGTALSNCALVTDGGRVLSVTGLGATVARAAETAYAAVDKIRWPGMQFRNDIAQRALLST